MQRTLTLLAIFLSLDLCAQQIPNNSFEDWQPELNGTYDEPSGSWWATLNFLRGFGPSAPITVNKTTSANSGTYAAEITTGEFGSFIIPGLLVTGDVGEIDLQDPTDVIKRGKPFTGLPEKFSGYYKHLPVNGDSAVANAMLTKFNTSTNQRDTIALAEQLFNTQANSYTFFEADFDYYLTGVQPDTIIIALVSSAGGQALEGQPGSKLFIDELNLSYVAGIEMSTFDAIAIQSYPNPCTDRISFEAESTSNNRTLTIYTLSGQVLKTANFPDIKLNIEVTGLEKGLYLFAVNENDKVVATGTINKAR